MLRGLSSFFVFDFLVFLVEVYRLLVLPLEIVILFRECFVYKCFDFCITSKKIILTFFCLLSYQERKIEGYVNSLELNYFVKK